MKINKQKVKKLLVSLEKINPDRCSHGNDRLDVEKFNKLKEVLEVKGKLKSLGVTWSWLRENNFIAWWVLVF